MNGTQECDWILLFRMSEQFSTIFNNIVPYIRKYNVHLFADADDVKMYIETDINDIQHAIDGINGDLHGVQLFRNNFEV